MSPPEPERKTATLISAGFSEPTVTLHRHVETREVVLPGPDGMAWEHIFECSVTGERRRYGVVERRDPAWVTEGN